ncbi:bifunctional glycosyltransferase/CDP-glycerol:glycerophosphate glycerophosphotransferase [Bacillus cereus group sp. MYBK40-2]|uniref:bifunctional glycosyltransferase/CDP-glycerol:glycerophosphate glycerophosphotransferase n=1 Tax=Bacillus cereus group TaxID=86661 RepID=UPI0014825BA7|nr:CDP-glycerol glycerophosphotransferase family protein [Bacillus cereus]MCU5386354.1 CDP-glycerol:glycerophosphate glycerophosphotransferase [Bacillus cereus]WAI16113.1 CDP-glycerol glycerophosphotransferase family protein [Bacillus cereus]HDR6273082.1 CDP-glycerol glycerophosphotransferase family protein [Bacillus cereus]
MHQDKISIIVPMYNVEEYIEQTIQSLLNQTYSNTEIILINDASTDKTGSIALSYTKKNKNIRFFQQDLNKGVSAARNIGLKLATGSYITFVDSDDLLPNQAIETMYIISQENEADLVIGSMQNFSDINNIFQNTEDAIIKNVSIEENPEIISNVFSCGKLYTKELLQKIQFAEDIQYIEDQPFAIQTFLNAESIVTTSSIVYYYRVRQSQNLSLTQSAFTNPITRLPHVFNVFNTIRNYFKESKYGLEHKSFTIYAKRLIEGSIQYLFIGSLSQNEPVIQQKTIKLLIDWIQTLDNDLLLKTGSFQKVFVETGEKYITYINAETLMYYIKLLKIIKEKMLIASNTHKIINETKEKNTILNIVLANINNYLIDHNYETKSYPICYPKVESLNVHNNCAIVQFQLIKNETSSLYEVFLSKINTLWTIANAKFITNISKQNITIKNTKPKILLTYRNFSGCNTLALYKSIPNNIRQHFDIELILVNDVSNEYTKKIIESDIVVTTNMEYNFNKQQFNPNQIVIDLWHGFPLKTMFYADPNYHDKNSISSFFKPLNYLASYSPLYNELLYKCVRVDPNNFVITGAPRNDLLFNSNSRELLCKFLDIEDNDQKFIFYMPTFRASSQTNSTKHSSNLFGFDDFDLSTFNQFLEKNNYQLIVKSHPLYGENYDKMLKGFSHISLFPDERLKEWKIDLYEVLGATDFLITDYSSVYFDYLLLNKPIIFTPTDLEEYNKDRGFLLTPFDKWTPGPKVFDQKNLQNELLSYETNSLYYEEARKIISNNIHAYQDGNSAERVWNFIEKLYSLNKNYQ